MAERRKPTPEEVNLGGIMFARIDSGASWIDYRMVGSNGFFLQTYKTHGQIGCGWITNKGIGYFLGIINKHIDQIDPAEQEKPLTVDVRSTKSEERPDTTDFFGPPIDIPFNSYEVTPPITLDDLEEAGHYSPTEPNRLKFLRVNTPALDYTFSFFDHSRIEAGAITTLDMNNWKNRIEKLAEYMNGTFAEPGFDKAGEILLGIIGREYPNALSSS